MYNQEHLNEAWFFAANAHKHQKYPRGDLPYLTHIGQVMMEIMAVSPTLENPELALLCAILHDTLEDTAVTYEELQHRFSLAVANGVRALSKRASLPTKEARMRDSLRRIQTQPQEVWAVKLADRIANLGTPPEHWDSDKRRRYHQESMLILETLGSANSILARRLAQKIEHYASYFAFS